jgi:uncharacterized protein (TIGR02453 family)
MGYEQASENLMPIEFTGFPEEALRFLRQLKLHNDRDWFRERKDSYIKHVEEPMKALVLAAAEGCRAKGVPLHAKEKNPVMRVYRDIRFSKNKLPYKTHVAAELKSSFGDSDCMLYIHISPEESLLAAGVWQPERPLLNAWREAIVKEPRVFDRFAQRLELKTEYSLSTMPRGFQNYARESFGPWLKLTSFVVSKTVAKSEITSPDLVQSVVDFAVGVKPLLEFGWHVEQTYAHLFQKPVLTGY